MKVVRHLFVFVFLNSTPTAACVCLCEELYPQDICIIHEDDCAKAAEPGGASAPIAPLSSPKISARKKKMRLIWNGPTAFLFFFSLQVTVEIYCHEAKCHRGLCWIS